MPGWQRHPLVAGGACQHLGEHSFAGQLLTGGVGPRWVLTAAQRRPVGLLVAELFQLDFAATPVNFHQFHDAPNQQPQAKEAGQQ